MSHLARRTRLWWLPLLSTALLVPMPSLADPPDLDGDGFFDSEDNCLDRFNDSQTDTDVDGYGNACDGDYNNDGVVNVIDLNFFKSVYLTGPPDSPTWCDNVNPNADVDDNGIINAIDFSFFKAWYQHPVGNSGLACAGDYPCAVDDDLDGDEVPNADDNCILDKNPLQRDGDLDGYGNRCDGDFDGDGVMTDADTAFFTCALRVTSPSQPGYNPAADLNDDGLTAINLGFPQSDFAIFGALRDRCTPGRSGLIQNPPLKPAPGPTMSDGDQDGFDAYRDNCSVDWNPSQSNSDHDLYGNACDADYNNDGVVDESDRSVLNAVMGLTPSDPGFKFEVDFDDSGEIDEADEDFFESRFLGAPGPSGLPCPPLVQATTPEAFPDYLHVFQGGVLAAELKAVDGNQDPLNLQITSPPSQGRHYECAHRRVHLHPESGHNRALGRLRVHRQQRRADVGAGSGQHQHLGSPGLELHCDGAARQDAGALQPELPRRG